MDNKIRLMLEEKEAAMLPPYAALSSNARRLKEEAPCGTRTSFQRDVDRIVYSKAFRRLKHKTQVFLQPEGDHYRTRMTHTLEVSRIARTLARALMLNEDLTEAAALGHDLGHTPFGHAGERALDGIVPGGFKHSEQSLRVVDRLEKDGRGLNLTAEVRDGIVCHGSSAAEPMTLEGKIVRYSDKIAYINHDIDDAVRAGILGEADIPAEIRQALGGSHSERIDTVVKSIIARSFGKSEVLMDGGILKHMLDLRQFLFDRVYLNPVVKGEEAKTLDILGSLYGHYLKHPDELPEELGVVIVDEGPERAVCDYISGMTDQYAVHRFGALFIPSAWSIKKAGKG